MHELHGKAEVAILVHRWQDPVGTQFLISWQLLLMIFSVAVANATISNESATKFSQWSWSAYVMQDVTVVSLSVSEWDCDDCTDVCCCSVVHSGFNDKLYCRPSISPKHHCKTYAKLTLTLHLNPYILCSHHDGLALLPQLLVPLLAVLQTSSLSNRSWSKVKWWLRMTN